jgi:hypothetical protein
MFLSDVTMTLLYWTGSFQHNLRQCANCKIIYPGVRCHSFQWPPEHLFSMWYYINMHTHTDTPFLSAKHMFTTLVPTECGVCVLSYMSAKQSNITADYWVLHVPWKQRSPYTQQDFFVSVMLWEVLSLSHSVTEPVLHNWDYDWKSPWEFKPKCFVYLKHNSQVGKTILLFNRI